MCIQVVRVILIRTTKQITFCVEKALNVNLVIVCRVSIQEKVRSSPNGFIRNGNERERAGGGGGGEWGRERRARKRTGKKRRSTLNQRHRCADLPSPWRLTSTRTHSLPQSHLLHLQSPLFHKHFICWRR